MFNSKYTKYLERQISELKEELKTVKQENFNLQAAIVAQRAPMAYEHFAKDYPEAKSVDVKTKQENMFLRQYSQAIEQPLFSSVDEMLESLGPRSGIPTTSSVHENSES